MRRTVRSVLILCFSWSLLGYGCTEEMVQARADTEQALSILEELAGTLDMFGLRGPGDAGEAPVKEGLVKAGLEPAPGLVRAIRARQAIAEDLLELKEAGIAGEGNDGRLHRREGGELTATGAATAAELDDLIGVENRNREIIYDAVAARGHRALGEVAATAADLHRQQAAPGHWVQNATGNWVRVEPR